VEQPGTIVTIRSRAGSKSLGSARRTCAKGDWHKAKRQIPELLLIARGHDSCSPQAREPTYSNLVSAHEHAGCGRARRLRGTLLERSGSKRSRRGPQHRKRRRRKPERSKRWRRRPPRRRSNSELGRGRRFAGAMPCTEDLSISKGTAGALNTTGAPNVPSLGSGCPATLCAAQVWASACGSFRSSSGSSSLNVCGDVLTITVNYSETRGRSCYYDVRAGAVGTNGNLVGLEYWDGAGSFCGGTSQHVRAGRVPTNCDESSAQALCDGTTSSAAPAQEPPAACFDLFSRTCAPCCEATPPDCSDKPDGYPGYKCVSRENAFCSCSCGAGSWKCAC
jgi:hypothetical protein